MSDYQIYIDMDKECSACGVKGATQSGLCMKCIANSIKNSGASGLMAMALGKALALLENQIIQYATKIHRAYLMAENGLKVGLSIDLSSDKPGKIDIETEITFIESKIKDKLKTSVIEGQEEFKI